MKNILKTTRGSVKVLREGHQFNISLLFITLEVKNYKHLEENNNLYLDNICKRNKAFENHLIFINS